MYGELLGIVEIRIVFQFQHINELIYPKTSKGNTDVFTLTKDSKGKRLPRKCFKSYPINEQNFESKKSSI